VNKEAFYINLKTFFCRTVIATTDVCWEIGHFEKVFTECEHHVGWNIAKRMQT